MRIDNHTPSACPHLRTRHGLDHSVRYNRHDCQLPWLPRDVPSAHDHCAWSGITTSQKDVLSMFTHMGLLQLVQKSPNPTTYRPTFCMPILLVILCTHNLRILFFFSFLPASCVVGKACRKGSFTCLNGFCRSPSWVLDGSDDCGDKSDEGQKSTRMPNGVHSDFRWRMSLSWTLLRHVYWMPLFLVMCASVSLFSPV
jgi:hypothetical protein